MTLLPLSETSNLRTETSDRDNLLYGDLYSVRDCRWARVVFMRSEVSMRQVTDGTSNTYIVGEKNVRPQAYEGGDSGVQVDAGDDEGYLIGTNGDCVRSAGVPPFPDDPYAHLFQSWSSSHQAGFYMMFADGSVRLITYNINRITHRGLGTRAGGEVIDAEAI